MKKFQIPKVTRVLSSDRGSVEDANNPIKLQSALLNFHSHQLREIYKKLESEHKAAQAHIETGRAFADVLKDYASKVNPESPLGTVLKSLAELHRSLEDLRTDSYYVLNSNLHDPIRDAVKGEIKEALELEKKYDKAKSAQESAETKLRQLNEKAKVNVAKIVEAEQERDALKSNFQEIEKESIKNLSETNTKTELELMARLITNTELYYDHLEQSIAKIRSFYPQLEEFKSQIEQSINDFERDTGRSIPKILIARSSKRSNEAEYDDNDDDGMMINDDLSSSSSSSTSYHDRKRKILDDIINAERHYLNHLKHIKLNYFIPLQKVQKRSKGWNKDK